MIPLVYRFLHIQFKEPLSRTASDSAGEPRWQLLRVDGEGKALRNPAGVITAESLCPMLAVSPPLLDRLAGKG